MSFRPCPHPPCSPASGAGCAMAMLERRKKQRPSRATAAGGARRRFYMQESIARAMSGAPGTARSAHFNSYPVVQLALPDRHSPVCTVFGDHHVQCCIRSGRPSVWVQHSHERVTHVWVEIHPSKGAGQWACALGQRSILQGCAPDLSGFDRLVRGPGIRTERADRRKASARRGKARRRRDAELPARAEAGRRAQGGTASR